MAAGLELSLYVMLGIGGAARTNEHALNTATALNVINPHFIRLRTFLPKINTPLLEDIQAGRFEMLGPHGVLKETARIIENLNVTSMLTSDHYTNYINLHGRLPAHKQEFLKSIESALQQDQSAFRDIYIGTQ